MSIIERIADFIRGTMLTLNDYDVTEARTDINGTVYLLLCINGKAKVRIIVENLD